MGFQWDPILNFEEISSCTEDFARNIKVQASTPLQSNIRFGSLLLKVPRVYEKISSFIQMEYFFFLLNFGGYSNDVLLRNMSYLKLYNYFMNKKSNFFHLFSQIIHRQTKLFLSLLLGSFF